jgi:nicotinamidase/pyrazinamidase
MTASRDYIGEVMDALIVVDVQNDFCPGGALAVPDGDAIVPAVNALAARTPVVIATRDWHPPDHSSFIDAGGPWPSHCVAGTAGAELVDGLDVTRVSAIVDKGMAIDAEGYSGFEQTGLVGLLRDRGVDVVHVAGLALDYCVRATALDAAAAGFDVVVHRSATRPVDVQPGDGDRAVDELRAAGVTVIE